MCDSLVGRWRSLADDDDAVCLCVCLRHSCVNGVFVPHVLCSMSGSSFSFIMSFFLSFFSFKSFLHLPFAFFFPHCSALCFPPFWRNSIPACCFFFPFSLRSPLPVYFPLSLNSHSTLLPSILCLCSPFSLDTHPPAPSHSYFPASSLLALLLLLLSPPPLFLSPAHSSLIHSSFHSPCFSSHLLTSPLHSTSSRGAQAYVSNGSEAT